MRTLTINIPEESHERFIECLCLAFGGYDNDILSESNSVTSNPETKEEFVNRRIVENLSNLIRKAEIRIGRNIQFTPLDITVV